MGQSLEQLIKEDQASANPLNSDNPFYEHVLLERARKKLEPQPAISLSNFRVTYQAPRYEDGKVLYDGYCAILADDAALDGAEVRVFDVPDVDEGQLAAAMFACDAMNRYPAMLAAVKKFIDAYSGPNAGRLGNGQARRSLDEFQSLLTTTTSK